MINPDGSLQQPTVSERERALGLPTGATAAPGLTDAQRHNLTGRVINMHALTTLLHATAVILTGDPFFSIPHCPVPAYRRVPVTYSTVNASCPVSSYTSTPVAAQPPAHSTFPFLQPTWPQPFSSPTALPPKPPLPNPPPYSLHPVSFQLHTTPVSGAVQSGGLEETPHTTYTHNPPQNFCFPATHVHAPPVAALLPHTPGQPDPTNDTEHTDRYTLDKGDIWTDAPVLQYLQTNTLPLVALP